MLGNMAAGVFFPPVCYFPIDNLSGPQQNNITQKTVVLCNKSVKTMERVSILDAMQCDRFFLFVVILFSKTLAFPFSCYYPIGHRKDI